MGFRKLSVLLGFFLQIVSLVAATTYGSIKTVEYQKSESLSDLISQISKDDPLIVFRFTRFPLMEALLPYEDHVPYLTKFFETDVTELFSQEVSSEDLQEVEEIETFDVEELTSSASQLLYDAPLEDKKLIIFNFEDEDYDLAILDEFLESAYLLLHNSFDRVDNVVLSVTDAVAADHFSADRKTKKAPVSHRSKKPVEDNDDDVLSTIWTEGLIMCLIVSLLLLGILVVAISWMGSVDISYGALEKSTNPLKKTK